LEIALINHSPNLNGTLSLQTNHILLRENQGRLIPIKPGLLKPHILSRNNITAVNTPRCHHNPLPPLHLCLYNKLLQNLGSINKLCLKLHSSQKPLREGPTKPLPSRLKRMVKQRTDRFKRDPHILSG